MGEYAGRTASANLHNGSLAPPRFRESKSPAAAACTRDDDRREPEFLKGPGGIAWAKGSHFPLVEAFDSPPRNLGRVTHHDHRHARAFEHLRWAWCSPDLADVNGSTRTASLTVNSASSVSPSRVVCFVWRELYESPRTDATGSVFRFPIESLILYLIQTLRSEHIYECVRRIRQLIGAAITAMQPVRRSDARAASVSRND